MKGSSGKDTKASLADEAEAYCEGSPTHNEFVSQTQAVPMAYNAITTATNQRNVGSTVNPKASLRWQPSSAWLVRAAAGTGFRAPSLTDLYTPQATSVTANGTRDLSLSLDAFTLQLKDAIVPGGVPSTYFLANARRATQYAQYILRGAPDGNASGVGPITGIVQTAATLFCTKAAGVDIDGRYTLRLDAANRVNFRISGTYLGKYDVQQPDLSYTSSLDQAQNGRRRGAALEAQRQRPLAHWGLRDHAVAELPEGLYRRRRQPCAGRDARPQGRPLPDLGPAARLRRLQVDPPYTNLTSNFLGGYDVS